LKTLFRVEETDVGFSMKSDHSERLKAHLIPKQCLSRVDDKSTREALESVSSLAKQKILELRAQDGTYQNGRAHAFWLQQFANSQLALETVKT